MQECGECTACCWAFKVTKANKKAREKCQYENGKCTIYSKRPKVCEDYKCAWLTQPKVGIELRPDKCGVIFTLVPNNVILVTSIKGQPKPIFKPVAERQIVEFKKQGYVIRYDSP